MGKKILISLYILCITITAQASYSYIDNYNSYMDSYNSYVDDCYENDNFCCFEESGFSDTLLIPFYGYSIGESIGIDHNFHEFGATLFFNQFDALYIFQGKALAFENSQWAYSFGGGMRWGGDCYHDPIFGVNAFYDYRNGCLDNFQQFSLGLELLNICCFDFRSNFYFPITQIKESDLSVFTYPDNFIATCFEQESSPCAVNFEVGTPICLSRGFSLYPAIAPYYLCFCGDNKLGARFRGVLSYQQWLQAEILVSHDSIFKTRVAGKFTLTLPFKIFYCSCHQNQCNCRLRRYQPINRFDAIILNKECCWTWNW